MNWLRHSGVLITLTLNPFQWRWRPRAYKENNREWPEGLLRSYRVAWLFLNIRLWIDNGSW